MSGKCICKPGIIGEKCDICPDGTPVTSKGCTGCKIMIRVCIEKNYTHVDDDGQFSACPSTKV